MANKGNRRSMQKLIRLLAAGALFAPLAGAQSLVQAGTLAGGVDDVELTGDGRWAVMRVNIWDAYARVQDVRTGQVWTLPGFFPGQQLIGETLDAVATTQDRAVVLGGAQALLLDLAGPLPVVVATSSVGYRPRDVTTTPDGTLALVRGGEVLAGQGGLYVLSMADGATLWRGTGAPPVLAAPPSATSSYNVDSVVATNAHAAYTSLVTDPSGPRTRVAIVELHPASGAPALAFESGGACTDCADLAGAPHDLVLSPDGTRLYVRSELEVAAYALDLAGGPGVVWRRSLAGNPGPFGDDALDSIEATDQRIATISRCNVAGQAPQTQVDVFDRDGGQRFGRFDGRPHDLAITAGGTQLLVRSSAGLAKWPLQQLSLPGEMQALAFLAMPATTYQYFAGFDSLATGGARAVFSVRDNGASYMTTCIVDTSGQDLRLLATHRIDGTRPTDVAISPDQRVAVVSGNASISVYHLGTGAKLFEHMPVGAHSYYQWCDGVAVDDAHAVAVGQHQPQAGWSALADIAPLGTQVCATTPNTAGSGARLSVFGTLSASSDRFVLAVDGLPGAVRGSFIVGQGSAPFPFGAGSLCVGGISWRARPLVSNASGSALTRIPAAALPAGFLAPGTVRHAQFLYSDPAAGGNASGSIEFVMLP